MKANHLLLAATMCLALNTATAASPNDAEQIAGEHVILAPEALEWGEGPKALPSGAQAAILEGDPTKAGAYTLRAKLPAGYKIPPHWHTGDEHVTVIKGTLYMGMGDVLDESKSQKLPVGGFALMPKKVHHFAYTGDEEAVIQLHGMGPWDIIYIDPNDDPRKNMNGN